MSGPGDATRPARGIAVAALIGCVLAASSLLAARAPLTRAEKELRASDVVTAVVESLDVRTEPAEGLGNTDWVVYLTLRVVAVEQGGARPGERLSAWCAAPRTRLSFTALLDAGPHAPIPEAGQTIHVYLRRDGAGHAVLFPDGVDTRRPDGQDVVEHPTRLRFTLWLPLEVWALSLALTAILLSAIWLHRQWRRRRPTA